MSHGQRLALVVMDERDGLGDDSGMPADSLVPELTVSVIAAQTVRLKRIEKKLDLLCECPEIVAMLARLEARRAY